MTDIAALVADNIDIWTSAIQRKSGVGRGSSKRISLYGIERLRALILDLAVRGKLVPQNAGDEAASRYLANISQRVDASSTRRRRKQALPDTADDLDLPSGWAPTHLGSIVDIVRGITFPGSEKSKVPEGGRIACLRTSNVQDQIEWEDILYIKEKFVSRTDQYVRENDIIISMANSRELVGKVAIVDCVPENPTAFGGFLAAIRAHSVDPRFLMTFLRCPTTKAQLIEDASQTTNIANISLSKLNPLPVSLPPLAEQLRIVAKVEALMALCDALERESAGAMAAHQALVDVLLATLVRSASAADLARQWARLDSHFDTLFTTDASIDALKKTILDLAVRGKLVEQHAGDEAASELLKQTANGKADLIRQGLAKRDKVLPHLDHSRLPFSLPSGWAWARFPELGIFERGKSKHRPRNDPKLFSPGIYPLIQTGEVARATGLIDEVHSHYSELGLAQSKLWKEGTLCITIAANIADAAIMGFDACFPDSVVGFIPAKPITDPSYFLYFIRTAKADLLRFAPSTAQKNINLGILETLLIPLPPLPEMGRIVAKVDALMVLCDGLKARFADTARIQRHLTDAIIERAAA